MTPAIAQARSAGIAFEIHELPMPDADQSSGRDSGAWALAGLPAERVFKTLIARLDDGGLVAVLIPIDQQLDFKRLATVAGVRRASMAQPIEAQRATGYQLGAISPLGLRRRLPVLIDKSAFAFPTICVSGGRRGLEMELSAEALRNACDARVAHLTRCGRAHSQ